MNILPINNVCEECEECKKVSYLFKVRINEGTKTGRITPLVVHVYKYICLDCWCAAT